MVDFKDMRDRMKSNGVGFENKPKRQNQSDGKLFLVDRQSLCPAARFSWPTPSEVKLILMPSLDSFISVVFRVPEFTRQLNKLCQYGSGVAFLSLFQTKNGTNGIFTFRTAETNVIFRTNELKIGAREDIAQKGLWQSRGEGRTLVIDLLGGRGNKLVEVPSPRFNYKQKIKPIAKTQNEREKQ